MTTKNISDDSFDQEVLKSSNLVLVDFWAEWCGPCKMIAPALEEISEEMNKNLEIKKLNIDDNPKTPQEYGVRGIPTLILFKNGEKISEKIGVLPKSKITEWVQESIQFNLFLLIFRKYPAKYSEPHMQTGNLSFETKFKA